MLSTLYVVGGTGAGLLLLLLFIKYLLKRNQTLSSNVEVLESQKEYRDEVIGQLSKPTTINDTINKLHDGKF